ncbi:MAG: aminotransferase class V-fold PLP-dependent enzyme [Candidatus Brocadiae bacterium]|nr:aminotransferase class V-fold PLP-dependent enzyme [Candidatus Brocadiia bacterium]
MIYANNAATTWPKPEPVYDAVMRSLRDVGVSVRSSSQAAPHGADALVELRAAVAGLLGAPDVSRLLFSPGCTHSLNQAIQGLPWAAGDVIVMSGLEHHAVSRPVRKMARERGARFEVSPYRPGMPFDLGWLEGVLRKGRVKLVATTMAANVTGEILPSAEIVALAHRHGALALLDGAQSAGVLDVNLKALDCDLFAAAGHKGLFGPPGVGVLYVSPAAKLQLWAEGGTGRDTGKHEMAGVYPHSFEVGTHNVPAIAGLAAGARWVQERGRAWIHETEQALCSRFLQGLDRIDGVTVYGTREPAGRTSVVSLNLRGWNPRDLSAWLASTHDVTSRAGYHCAPLAHETIGSLPGPGTIRFSFGCFNTDAEVDTLLALLADAARRPPKP